MWRTLWFIITLFFVFSNAALAKEDGNKKFLEWHLRDLYYYDNNDAVVQLELAPKLFIRFTKELTAEERISFFSEFSPIAQKPEPGDPLSLVLYFDNSVKSLKLLEMANKMAHSGLAVVSPVFLIENIEAIIDGVAVEPKIVLTAERLYERMKKYGDFSSRKTDYENGAWVFLIDEVKPPLNLLVFTNLVKKDEWVKRAYPHFKFLHDPITAFIDVEPVSGTVGEIRTVTLTIKIFDPTMLLSESELPEFGNGLFTPIQGIPAGPQTIKYPPGYLFELVGEPLKSVVKNQNKVLIYKIYRKFKFYALGEWTIHHQVISYIKNGAVKEIKSSGFSFIVNSQIGNLKITDMPYPRSLINPSGAPIVVRETKFPEVPSYWFDSFMSKKDYETIKYSKLLSLSLGLFGIFIFTLIAVLKLRKVFKRKAFCRSLVGEIEMIINTAKEHKSYAEYEEVLSRILVGALPHLSQRHLTWGDIEDDQTAIRIFNRYQLEIISLVFTELGKRHMRDFTPQPDSLRALDGYVRDILGVARHHFFYLEED